MPYLSSAVSHASAAAGTTNAALACYLLRQGLIDATDNAIELTAEQGIELGRSSRIESRLSLKANAIQRLQVGGVATRVLDGKLYI